MIFYTSASHTLCMKLVWIVWCSVLDHHESNKSFSMNVRVDVLHTKVNYHHQKYHPQLDIAPSAISIRVCRQICNDVVGYHGQPTTHLTSFQPSPSHRDCKCWCASEHQCREHQNCLRPFFLLLTHNLSATTKFHFIAIRCVTSLQFELSYTPRCTFAPPIRRYATQHNTTQHTSFSCALRSGCITTARLDIWRHSCDSGHLFGVV